MLLSGDGVFDVELVEVSFYLFLGDSLFNPDDLQLTDGALYFVKSSDLFCVESDQLSMSICQLDFDVREVEVGLISFWLFSRHYKRSL